MARIRIGVEKLGAEGMRLEVEGVDGVANILALAPGGGIRGRYESDDTSIGLHGLRADSLAVSEFSWGLAWGRFRGSARLIDVEVEAVIATAAARGTRPAFVGTVRARALEATVELVRPGTNLNVATLRVEDFSLTAGEDGRVILGSSRASASTLRAMFGNLEIIAQDVQAPDAIALVDGVLRVESISVGSVQTVVPLAGVGAAKEARAAKADRPPLSLPFVDLLSGHVHVDVIVDVTLPIIGHRAATHRFRVPVTKGAIDFGVLESGLSTLENMVIDFEVQGDKLVLEKDIPLIPFDEKPLVTWQLDAAGQELARRKHVRIATLLQPQIPVSARQQADNERKKGAPSMQLRRIDVQDLDVALAVGGGFELEVLGGRVAFGSADVPAIAELRVRGNATYAPGESPPGEVATQARAIAGAFVGLHLGSRLLDAGQVEIQAVEGTVDLAGIKPQRLTSRITGLVARKLELRR